MKTKKRISGKISFLKSQRVGTTMLSLKLTLLVIVLLILKSSLAQTSLYGTIKGQLPALKAKKIFITYLPPGLGNKVQIDSCVADEYGRFKFNTPYNEPVLANLYVDYTASFRFLTDVKEVTIVAANKAGPLNSNNLKALSPANKFYAEYLKFIEKEAGVLAVLYDERERLRNENKKDSLILLMPQLEIADSILLDKNIQYVKNNKYSPLIRTIIIYRKTMLHMPVQELFTVFSAFPKSVQGSIYGMAVSEFLQAKQQLKEGMDAPDFVNQFSPEGKKITLADFRGKYLLIDFWAAWCVPCREENPKLKAIYQKFKKSGFEILGISLDKKKEDWVKAIKTDSLPWAQASDIKFWQSESVALYGLYALPSNVLLDSTGIILGINLSSEDIETKLNHYILRK